jgi:hypothetical protein
MYFTRSKLPLRAPMRRLEFSPMLAVGSLWNESTKWTHKQVKFKKKVEDTIYHRTVDEQDTNAYIALPVL